MPKKKKREHKGGWPDPHAPRKAERRKQFPMMLNATERQMLAELQEHYETNTIAATIRMAFNREHRAIKKSQMEKDEDLPLLARATQPRKRKPK